MALNYDACLTAARVLEVAARKLRKLAADDPKWRPHEPTGSILTEVIEDASAGIEAAKIIRAEYMR